MAIGAESNPIHSYHYSRKIGGQRNYLPWWPCWILDLALKQDAIILNPDHRLIPEATTEDVLDDISDLWQWINTKLDSTLQQSESYNGLHPDLNRVILSGESAGGYLALQTGLSFFDEAQTQNQPTNTTSAIRAIIAQYPAVSWRSPMWSEKYHKELFGTPQYPESIVDDVLASIQAEREQTGKQPIASNISLFTSTGEFNERAKLAFSSQQNARYHQLLGPERDTTPGKRRVFPEDRIEDGRILPPTVFLQGLNDTITPVEGCDAFVEHVRKHKAVTGLSEGRPEREVLFYCKVPGEHLFENDINMDEHADPWVNEVVSFVEGHWLK